MGEVQLTLGAFDPDGDALCGDLPAANRFRRLCIHCPKAVRIDGQLFCERYGHAIGARDKYGLAAWKHLRERVLSRDGERCMICGRNQDLHVHHIDLDAKCDALGNLVTLCGACHARAHTKMRQEGEAERIRWVLERLVRQGPGGLPQGGPRPP
jgi:hypothetical protein